MGRGNKGAGDDYLVTVLFRGPAGGAWEECCTFVVIAETPEAAAVKAKSIEPVVREQSWRRIGELDFTIKPLDDLRGFYGTLVRALGDKRHQVTFPPGRLSPRRDRT